MKNKEIERAVDEIYNDINKLIKKYDYLYTQLDIQKYEEVKTAIHSGFITSILIKMKQLLNYLFFVEYGVEYDILSSDYSYLRTLIDTLL